MKNNPISKEINIDEFFKDPMFISRTIQAGMNKELLKHKQAGNPICTWKDGRVVWIPAEEIQINPTIFNEDIEQNKEDFYKELDESLSREQGKLEGKKEFLVMLLNNKFGQVPATFLVRIDNATADEIEKLSNKILSANSIDDLFN